jgi:hypothetical protein
MHDSVRHAMSNEDNGVSRRHGARLDVVTGVRKEKNSCTALDKSRRDGSRKCTLEKCAMRIMASRGDTRYICLLQLVVDKGKIEDWVQNSRGRRLEQS